jgi:hypothetical protein
VLPKLEKTEREEDEELKEGRGSNCGKERIKRKEDEKRK